MTNLLQGNEDTDSASILSALSVIVLNLSVSNLSIFLYILLIGIKKFS